MDEICKVCKTKFQCCPAGYCWCKKLAPVSIQMTKKCVCFDCLNSFLEMKKNN